MFASSILVAHVPPDPLPSATPLPSVTRTVVSPGRPAVSEGKVREGPTPLVETSVSTALFTFTRRYGAKPGNVAPGVYGFQCKLAPGLGERAIEAIRGVGGDTTLVERPLIAVKSSIGELQVGA